MRISSMKAKTHKFLINLNLNKMNLVRTYKRLEEYINTPTIYDIDPYYDVVDQINDRYEEILNWSEEDLKKLHYNLQSKVAESCCDEEDVIEGFALIKALCFRLLDLEAYDVQLVTGLVVYEGRIAEMMTGEGKTLAALFPTYLRAIEGKGIHVHTFNDYLSLRDYRYFNIIYDFLGMSSSCILDGMEVSEIYEALSVDITYGSAKQFLYSYLKLTVADGYRQDIQDKFQYAIIDEADAILLDEATNPFVIAGKSLDFNIDFYQIAKAVKLLVKANLFEYTDFKRGVFLTEKGAEFIEVTLGLDDLFHEFNHNILSAINLSLHAHVLLNKDQDYIVFKDEILLVDEFTGRVVHDRKWRNGLQTAVEAKENLPIKSEGSILNTISIPNFYRQYDYKGAMTATAKESAKELKDSYGLVLVVIPPNIPSKRRDLETRVFRNAKLKYEAVIDEIILQHRTGRPILLGTQHISESEHIHDQLTAKGIKCNILNAKNDALEAETIAKAGMLNAITISTNMAGRGTDIKLGGELGIRKEEIEDLGGLLVIGTNMHRSGRIDRQLRGRAGRQGEPGVSQFFVSLEDELFDKNKMTKVLPKKFRNVERDEIVNEDIHKFLLHAQEVSEDQDNLMRETINQYSEISFHQSQLVKQKREEVWKNGEKELVLKNAMIDVIDRKWANNVSQLFEVKDGIHYISLGGQNPLRAYIIIADKFFKDLEIEIGNEMKSLEQAFSKNRLEFEEMTKDKVPSSTWTYTVSDKGFNSGLEGLLKGSGNVAFQVDFFGLTFLFGKYLFHRTRNAFHNLKSRLWK